MSHLDKSKRMRIWRFAWERALEAGMSFLNKMAKMAEMIGRRTVIRFVGEPRPGGYCFIKSPDFLGFSLMLEPGEEKDIHTFMDAIYGPLVGFLEAESKAAGALFKSHSETLRVTGIRRGHHGSSTDYVAELCEA